MFRINEWKRNGIIIFFKETSFDIPVRTNYVIIEMIKHAVKLLISESEQVIADYCYYCAGS